jgi:hypothetical protein
MYQCEVIVLTQPPCRANLVTKGFFGLGARLTLSITTLSFIFLQPGV